MTTECAQCHSDFVDPLWRDGSDVPQAYCSDACEEAAAMLAERDRRAKETQK